MKLTTPQVFAYKILKSMLLDGVGLALGSLFKHRK